MNRVLNCVQWSLKTTYFCSDLLLIELPLTGGLGVKAPLAKGARVKTTQVCGTFDNIIEVG